MYVSAEVGVGLGFQSARWGGQSGGPPPTLMQQEGHNNSSSKLLQVTSGTLKPCQYELPCRPLVFLVGFAWRSLLPTVDIQHSVVVAA